MADESDAGKKVRISPIDCRGRAIAPEVLSVAYEISGRALRHAEKVLGDPALALSAFEESAATVSRVVRAQQRLDDCNIRNLHAYLFRAFLRRINRLKPRELPVGDDFLGVLPESQSSDLANKLEIRLLVDEILTKCDVVTRDMFFRRAQGFSWREIGNAYGISSHAAESRFSQALHRLRKKLNS